MTTDERIKFIRDAIRLIGETVNDKFAWGQRSFASGLLSMCSLDGSISFEDSETLRKELEDAYKNAVEGK